jgi:hypothetical protein
MAGLFDSMVTGGLSLYDKLQDRQTLPANKRVFLESMLENNRTPITEQNLSKSEQDALKELVRNKYAPLQEPAKEYKAYLENTIKQKDIDPSYKKQAIKDLSAISTFLQGTLTPDFLSLAAGDMGFERSYLMSKAGLMHSKYKTETGTPFAIKPNIQYSDYSPDKAETFNKFSINAGNQGDARGSLQTLLGRFNFNVDPKGNLVVKDTYDFNAPQINTLAEANYEAAGAMGPYQVLRTYAGEKMPEGQGRNINMTVPLGIGLYKDPFTPTIK